MATHSTVHCRAVGTIAPADPPPSAPCAATIASPSGRAVARSASFGCLRGRPRRAGRGVRRRGVPRTTVRWDEIPSAYGRRNRCNRPRNRRLSPNSASASTPVTVNATRPDLPQQRQRLAPLFLKSDRGGDARAFARRVGDPLLGQIQRAAEQIGPGPGPQRGGDGHLTIGDLPQRPAVLARHADRVRPLFGEARAIEDQQPCRARESRARRRRQTASAFHGASVMKCWKAWYDPGSVTRASIASIDLRALSLSNPCTYRRRASTCARWPKHTLNASSHVISRRN